jgi:hypothetical protein
MTKTNVAISNAAQTAATKLASWDAVQAEAKHRLAEAEAKTELSDNFAEIHFSGASVQGVIKVGNTVLKLSN